MSFVYVLLGTSNAQLDKLQLLKAKIDLYCANVMYFLLNYKKADAQKT